MTPADVSVVIPALNEAAQIATTLESVRNNGAGQVLLCDGGSTDQTARIAAELGATVLHGAPGRGVQLAAGADHATGPVLLFLHADNRLGDSCLEKLCDYANRSDIGDDFWGGFRQQILADSFVYRLLEHGNAARVRFRGMPFGDQGLFVTRTLYDRVGGIRPVSLMEDVLLSRALRRICWPALIDAAIDVDARRWQSRGVVRQTLRNWGIQLAHRFGVTESRLSKWYR